MNEISHRISDRKGHCNAVLNICNITYVHEICANPFDTVGFDEVLGETPFPEESVVAWCDACVHPQTRSVDPLGSVLNDPVLANLRAMQPFDMVALAFSSAIVAVTIVGEIKDIALCNMAIRHAGDDLNSGWRFALMLTNGLRRWAFLPVLVVTINFLVLFRGGVP